MRSRRQPATSGEISGVLGSSIPGSATIHHPPGPPCPMSNGSPTLAPIRGVGGRVPRPRRRRPRPPARGSAPPPPPAAPPAPIVDGAPGAAPAGGGVGVGPPPGPPPPTTRIG